MNHYIGIADFFIKSMVRKGSAGLADNLKMSGVPLLCLIGVQKIYGMPTICLVMIITGCMICIIRQD